MLYVMRLSGKRMYAFLVVDGILEIAREYHEVFTIKSHKIFGNSSLTENIFNASMEFWITY